MGRRERELFLMLPWHHQTDSVLAPRSKEVCGGKAGEGIIPNGHHQTDSALRKR